MDAIDHTKIKKLFVLTSGPITPNPSELLGSAAMKELLKQVRNHFDLIIIDTPPVLPVTDSQILANQCDGVILVIKAGVTKKQHVEKTKALLLNAKAKILGTVLNHTKERYQDYYYGDYDV